jgi:hypothetical protein
MAFDLTADGAAPALARDRVDDWLEELQRVALAAPTLSAGACDRVVAVIDACESEDGWLPPLAVEARLLLAGALGSSRQASTPRRDLKVA